MKEELDFIMNLMEKEFTINTLKEIKEKIKKEKNENQITEIIENDKCPTAAAFFLSTKHIEVNYGKMLNHAIIYANRINNSYGITKEELKLIEILTAYRMLLHEIHHSKQMYNVFDTNNMDPETEIIRSILNISRKDYLNELKTKSREEIIEERTFKINNMIIPYSEINPIERKAEIESLKGIRNIIEPIKSKYIKIYDEIHFNELLLKTDKYDEYSETLNINMTPYIQILRLIKQNLHLPRIYLPYNTSTYKEAMNELSKKTSEQERLDLGLEVKHYTLQKANDRMNLLTNNIIL